MDVLRRSLSRSPVAKAHLLPHACGLDATRFRIMHFSGGICKNPHAAIPAPDRDPRRTDICRRLCPGDALAVAARLGPALRALAGHDRPMWLARAHDGTPAGTPVATIRAHDRPVALAAAAVRRAAQLPARLAGGS